MQIKASKFEKTIRVIRGSLLQRHIAAGDALQMPVLGAQQQGAVVIQ